MGSKIEEARELSFKQEMQRIVATYAKRDASGKRALYGWSKQDSQLNRYRLHSQVAKLFDEAGLDNLDTLNVLDIGCGTGGWIRTMVEWGADPTRVHGIDLLSDRIEEAKRIAPHMDYRVASAWPIPFRDASMDLVSAHTVLSSVLDPAARKALAAEIIRVLRPGGHALIFDFRVRSPTNPNTIGIPKREIERIFPGMSWRVRSLILAPPIQRRIVLFSPLLASMLEGFVPILRTHACYLLEKPGVGPIDEPNENVEQ